MTKKFLNNIDLNGTLTIAGSGGTDGYFLKTDGTGVISWAAASGGGSGFTGAGTSITNITGAASNNMTIKAATSGNGTLTLLPSGQGNININNPYITRPAGSVSIIGQVPTGVDGGHIYIQSAYPGSGAPGNIYIDGQYDEVGSRGNVYIGTGIDGQASASGAINIGLVGQSGINLYSRTYAQSGINFYSTNYVPISFANTTPYSVTSNSIDTTGDFLTFTSNGGTAFGRGIVRASAMAFSTADATSVTTTTPQSIFQSGARALTLEAGKTYYFRLNLSLNFTFSTVAASIQLVPTFSQTPVAVNYGAIFISGTSGGVQSFRITTTGAQSISPTLGSSTTGATSIVEGFFRTNATTGGTVEFKYQINTGGGSSAVAKVGSLQEIMKIGAGAPGIVSGAWA